jgi:hypothetical protein
VHRTSLGPASIGCAHNHSAKPNNFSTTAQCEHNKPLQRNAAGIDIMKVRLSSGLFRPAPQRLAKMGQCSLRYFSARASLCQHRNEDMRFPGALEAKFTTNLKFENPKEKEVIPCYRVMDSEGVIVDKSYQRDFSDEEALKLYTNMVGVSIMDLICLDAQRQGDEPEIPRQALI